MRKGRLTLVGTGYGIAAQVTQQALTCLQKAERLFYLVPDPVTSLWLESLNASAESLHDLYEVGKLRMETYENMVERILEPVRGGHTVCAAFYGHPGVLVYPAHEAMRQARSEGHFTQMLPGVSAMDCLFSEIGVDPGTSGCQMYEASDFLYRQRRFDPCSALVLWQVGSIGVSTYKEQRLWSSEGLQILQEVLLKDYPPELEVIVYEASPFPVCPPKILRIPLQALASSDVTGNSTLYIPPRGGCEYDWEIVRRLAPSQPA